MCRIIIFLLIITFFQVKGQNCETYNRNLFKILPSELPDTLNCTDTNGKKQGWWLIYEIKMNPARIPDELEEGEYVESYSFGKYLEDKKIGAWKTVQNVHQIYISRTDSFIYRPGSTTIISGYFEGGWNVEKVTSSDDGRVIELTYQAQDSEFPIQIFCNKDKPTDKQCTVNYRGQSISTFPFENFEIEKELLWISYDRQRKQIDSRKN